MMNIKDMKMLLKLESISMGYKSMIVAQITLHNMKCSCNNIK